MITQNGRQVNVTLLSRMDIVALTTTKPWSKTTTLFYMVILLPLVVTETTTLPLTLQTGDTVRSLRNFGLL